MPRNERTLKQLRENTIFGNEITNTARITKMNMILAGDGHSNIQMKNSLANPVNEKYDIVVTNMPYSQTTEYGSLYDIPTKNGDSICVQHCIKAIDKTAENGRLAIVVPEGFLFRKDLAKTRKYLLEKCELQSIISLPTGVFLPYTGVKTNVVYLKKVNKKSTKNHYWNFDVKNDGYSLDNNRRKIDGENDLEKYLSNRNPEATSKKETLNVGFDIISIDDVIKNDYILVGSQYKSIHNHDNIKFKLAKLKDVVKVLSGFPFSSQNFSTTEGFPIIRIRDIKTNKTDTKFNGEYKSEYVVKNGDLIIGMDGDFNHILWEGGDALLNQRICKIYDYQNCLKEYIFHIIRKPLKLIWDNTPYTTVKHISIKQILDITIPLPPIEVQQEIVNKLKKNQKIIDDAKRKIDELEQKNKIEISEIWGD
jgi:type I restriction enzyme M protein